jgi:hypothetical protein
MNAVVRHLAPGVPFGGQRYSRKMPQAEDMTGRFPDDRTPRLSFRLLRFVITRSRAGAGLRKTSQIIL